MKKIEKILNPTKSSWSFLSVEYRMRLHKSLRRFSFMRKIMIMLLTVLSLVCVFDNRAFAEELDTPEKPIDIEETQTVNVNETITVQVREALLRKDFYVRVTGSVTKRTDAYGNVTVTNNLSSYISGSYSYDNNAGDGILYNVHYGVTNDHRAYVSGYVKITTGNYSGNTYYFYQKLA